MHDLSLITTIAAGFTAAWLLGLITQRLRLSPIVGYLLAGVLIGPHTPGFIGDLHIAGQLAEVGVILLMFGVGLRFHIHELLAVKGVAIPGALGQSLVATVVAIAAFSAFGLSALGGAMIGMAMAVASTVVLVRVLSDAGDLDSPQGHVAVGWLVVEDILTVVLLVLVPALGEGTGAARSASQAAGGSPSLWQAVGIALLKLAVLGVILRAAGARFVPWVLSQVARLRSRELFTLTVLVFSVAVAAGAYFYFGASMALGAFLAGMMVAQSPVSHQAAADALPLRDAFAALFFVSVGMLFDPAFVLREPAMLAAALGIILVVKPVAALLIVALLGHSVRTGLTVALGLAQIGEFSFILGSLAVEHGLMSDVGQNLLVASAIISITLNPLLFGSLPGIESWLRSRPAVWRLLNARAERRARRALREPQPEAGFSEPSGRMGLVVGYGPVGRAVQRLLHDAGMRTVVIDQNLDTVLLLRNEGQAAIFGDAAREAILEQAGARRASHVVVTVPHASVRASVAAAARNLNPDARVFVRARYLREREELERAGATAAVFEEAEAAVALARLVLADTGVHRDAAERKVSDLRLRLIMENISSIRAQRVRGVMVPWMRVRKLSATAGRPEVLTQVALGHYSRWPVVDSPSGRVMGYLLVKDLLNQPPDGDWTQRVRPLRSISPDDDVESALARMREEGASVYLVEDAGVPVGLVTLEDILEQVVGRIEDEYPHDAGASLRDAVARGGVVLALSASERDATIRELAGAIPPQHLPPGIDAAEITRLALDREAEYSTDLGTGVAIPHARCPGLVAPLIVVGRSPSGVVFAPPPSELVRLAFLLVSPADKPDLQLTLLGELARVAGDAGLRSRLMRAETREEVVRLLGESRVAPSTRAAGSRG